MTYKSLNRAYLEMCYGARAPILLALNPIHKQFLAELYMGFDQTYPLTSFGSVLQHLPEVKRYGELMQAKWLLYKGALLVWDSDVPENKLRGWFTRSIEVPNWTSNTFTLPDLVHLGLLMETELR